MPSKSSRPRQHTAIHYRVELADLQAHLFRITLTIDQPATTQCVALPVWIPGSYLVREFAGHLQNLQARQNQRALPANQVQQLDKCTWQIDCEPARPLVLVYEVYANDASVRTASLSASRGFFNGTSLCLRVEGQQAQAHAIEVVACALAAGWSVATGLTPQKIDSNGFGAYLAADYSELVDCPFEMGPFWSGTFEACGVPHRFVVAGAAPTFDGAQLLADTQKICETQIRFWHGAKKPPFKHYLFMLNAVDDGYGGLEHRNSTALICSRRDLPRLDSPASSKPSEGYTTLRGLISHEYFHTWNVKRLRPAEFKTLDYSRENYTQLLWFFEGFTSYYDDLLLRRAGLLDDAGYLKLLNKTMNQVMQAPGRLVQSVAQARFDAWVKYYRQDENTPNATVSYYTKGALVALCFDLSLRSGEGSASRASALDQVMRALWLRCEGGPMTETDFAAELQAAGGRPFAVELAAWVHGTAELPLQDLLETHGVAVLEEPAQLEQRLGLRVSQTSGVIIKTVLRGGAAEQAGLMAGDEWLGIEPLGTEPLGTEPINAGVNPQALTTAAGWRLGKLDDLLLYARTDDTVLALISRDRRLMRLPLLMPPASTTWRLAVKDAALVARWLASAV